MLSRDEAMRALSSFSGGAQVAITVALCGAAGLLARALGGPFLVGVALGTLLLTLWQAAEQRYYAGLGWRPWRRLPGGEVARPEEHPAGTEPPPLPGGGTGHVVVTWKYEDDLEGDDAIGPVWVERFADGGATGPATEVRWEWTPRTEARAFARAHGYAFEEV